jgi:hypothetical protein
LTGNQLPVVISVAEADNGKLSKGKEAQKKKCNDTKAIYDFFLKLKPRIIPDDNYRRRI